MKTYTQREAHKVLENHRKWLNNEAGGERANLRRAKLKYVDFRCADLRDVDLRYAYLKGADLRNANLRFANLEGAYLQGVDLGFADLTNARYNESIMDAINLDRAKGISIIALTTNIASDDAEYVKRHNEIVYCKELNVIRVQMLHNNLDTLQGDIEEMKEMIDTVYQCGCISKIKLKRIVRAIEFIEREAK